MAKLWCQKIIACWAKHHPKEALENAEYYVAEWAESIIREAAKNEPLIALKHYKKYWGQSWDPSIIKDILPLVSFETFMQKLNKEELAELCKAPWFKNVGLQWAEA